MVEFYRNAEKLDHILKIERPIRDNLTELLGIIRGDNEATIYFYENNKNGGWVKLLKDAGEFEGLGKLEGEVGAKERIQSVYLEGIAGEKPAEVLDVIGEIDAQNGFIRGSFVGALLKMPVDVAVKGTGIACRYLEGRIAKEWYFVGESAAKLMTSFAEKYKNEAFKIANVLLDVWEPEDSEKSIFNDIVAKFAPYEYEDLVFKHYKKLWELYPFRATKLLVEIFDRYLNELNKKKDFDVSEHFYITIENLDAIDRINRDYIAVLVKGVCEAGKAIIDKDPDRFDEFLNLLKGSNKAIFKRIEMYLLRFVPKGTYTERVSEILLDKGLFESYKYEHEYDLLLYDKIDEVGGKVEDTYKKWIEEVKVEDKENFADWFKNTRGREHTKEDLEKYESRMRASRLFSVRDKFPQLYEKYKKQAEATDAELMPLPTFQGGIVSPTEGSPITAEEMIKMEPAEALEYVSDPKKWKVDKKSESVFHSPEEGLQGVFKEVVQKRHQDYINPDINQRLLGLSPNFLSRYFYAVWDIERSKEWNKEYWRPLLDLAQSIVEKYKSDTEYRYGFSAILSMLRDGFGESERSIGFNEGIIRTFWGILNPLVKYTEEGKDESFEQDPVQMRCSSVKGQALEQVVMLGIVCKRNYEKLYNEYLKDEIRGILDYVVNEVKRPEVNCTFGTDFARIYWLDEEWLKNNLDKILEGEMWDVVWGTYTTWGRPSVLAFKLLEKQGQYRQAIESLGTPNKYKFHEDPAKGLTAHLMIAFFNGWLKDDCKNGLLNEFLKKAPAKLRGYASEFLTTGFKKLKENPNSVISGRLKAYWEMRLGAVGENAKENIEETVEFVGWVKDSPFETQETFRLLYNTLELTGGKIGGGRSLYVFLEGVCDIAKNNELIALLCLNKAMADERMGTFISLYKDKLTRFMDSIVGLGDDYREIQDIRKEAIKLADAYGRRHIYDFRKHYEALQKKIERV